METVVETDKPRQWHCTNAEYHADRTAESHSTLECFRDYPDRYRAIYVDGTLERDQPTEAMILGSMVHSLILEPENFEQEFAVAPSGLDRRTKAGKEVWAVFEASIVNRAIVSEELYEQAENMAAAARAHDQVQQALEANAWREVGICWTDPATGIALKVRPDFCSLDAPILDIKTTTCAKPHAWARTVVDFGYHRQAALYVAGVEAFYEVEAPFVHVAIEKRAPHRVVCHQLPARAIERGRKQNAVTLARLAAARINGEWGTNYPGIQVTDLPEREYHNEL